MEALPAVTKESTKTIRQVDKEVTRVEQMSRETRERMRRRKRSTDKMLEEVAEKSSSDMMKGRPIGLRKTVSTTKR